MKDAYEVLRQKEFEVARLKKEVEALRVAAPLLSENGEGANEELKPAAPAAANDVSQPTTFKVNEAYGQPEKILDLGAEQVYMYKDVKVTFENGRVKDVKPRSRRWLGL